MDKMFQNNSGEQSEHPAREMLLLFVDGELPAKETAQLETHLEACWPCRVKTKKIQEAIADIIEFDEQVLTPRLTPSQGWRNFDRQLRQLAAQSGSQSLKSRLFGSLNRFFPISHFVAIPRPSFKPTVRGLAAVLVLILVAALVIRFRHEPIVSASELLRNATDAQAAKLRSTAEPVVHQRLRVRRHDQASASEASATLEIWNDTKNARVREFAVDGNQTVSLSGNVGKSTSLQVPPNPVIDDLAQVLSFNHMDPQRPLSAASYQSWHNTLQRQRDEVTRSKLPGGVDALTLRTVPASPVNVGQIAEAVFIVRANDWLPSELRLSVHAEAGNRVYELTEDLSEVLDLAQVDPKIFANETVASAPAPKASPQMSPASSPLAKLNPSIVPLLVQPVATADLEVEALQLLNQVGADLGEQVSVKRTQEGTLQVSGIVETEQRKTEILNALAPIRNNPAVRVEIQTVAEAVAKQTNTPNPSPSTRAVQIAGNTMAAEPELRTYFAREGGNTDEAVRRFAARMVGLSNQAMDHLWAMKRLLNQFSPEEQRALTPDARAKWFGLIRAHARSYQQTTQSLRRELQPVFFPGQSTAGASAEGEGIADTNELARAVDQLFELGSSNDRVIRSAFTSSSGGAMTTVIKAPQFWQALKNAESLAAKIGAVARP
jgi:anti-sigma factor RsiW